MPYVYLICAFILNASGNIFLKLGSRQGLVLTSTTPVSFVVSNWQFILGCGLFVLNVPFYFLALKYIPLSTAYPIMVGASFVIINMLAFLLFKESINFLQLIGYACIVIGLVLVVSNVHP